jgi:hypothetical protein
LPAGFLLLRLINVDSMYMTTFELTAEILTGIACSRQTDWPVVGLEITRLK